MTQAVLPAQDSLNAAGRPAIVLSYLRARAQTALPVVVFLWIFSGGFVLIEPSPYEAMFFLVLPVAILAGVGLHARTLNLFNLLLMFTPFALIAAFQVRYIELSKSLLFVGITFYLWFSSYFVANYVADAPLRHMRLIMRSYTVAALIVALIGFLAYLGYLPNRDMFLLYGRAKATFEDPNVYGPFLVVPAMFALQRVFMLSGRPMIRAGLIYLALFTGIFISFSRGAWGHLGLSSVVLFVLVYALEAQARERGRMLALAIGGVIAVAVLLAALLSIESVRNLFEIRASVTQSYDTGETGRLGRQAYAYAMALSHPWGLGPLEFTAYRINEEPHNTYASVFLNYGWGGGFAYVAMVLITLWRGAKHLFIPSPNRLLLLPLMAVFVALAAESVIIDSDHWRHFFLVVGLIWGVTARYQAQPPSAAGTSRALRLA